MSDIDPLRERDLPNAERMLSRILSEAAAAGDAEDLDQLDAPARPPRRWLQAVAAAAAVVVLASIGWVATRPDHRDVEPGNRPTAPVVTPTPTPSPEPTPEETQAAVPAPAPATTRPATPRRTPTPTPTPTPTRSASPTATPTPTPTPSATPTISPHIHVNAATRTRPSRAGYEYAQIDLSACPGSRGARIYGPSVEGATQVVSGENSLSAGGSLVNRNSCIQFSVVVEIPEDPTVVTVAVRMEYAAGTPETVNNGSQAIAVTI